MRDHVPASARACICTVETKQSQKRKHRFSRHYLVVNEVFDVPRDTSDESVEKQKVPGAGIAALKRKYLLHRFG